MHVRSQHTVKSGQAKIHSLNRQIDAESSKLRKDEPTNIAAIEESRKVRRARHCSCWRLRELTPHHSQEVHDELNMMLEQYQAGVDERARENLDYAPAVSRKHALDDDIAAATKLLAKLSVRRVPVFVEIAELTLPRAEKSRGSHHQPRQRPVCHRAIHSKAQRAPEQSRGDAAPGGCAAAGSQGAPTRA